MREPVADLEGLHGPHAHLIADALAELSPGGCALALDIGCGPGLKAGLLAPHLGPGGRALGVDIDRPALGAARAAGLGAIAGDAHRLPLRDACADLAWMVATLGLLARPGLALAEARRVLRPGGALVVAGASALWCRPRAWPPELAAALDGAPLPPPADGLGEELRAPLAGAGLAVAGLRAYLLDPPGLTPAAARLPLLAWAGLGPLVAARLAPAVAAACAAAEAEAEAEPLPLLLAGVGIAL